MKAVHYPKVNWIIIYLLQGIYACSIELLSRIVNFLHLKVSSLISNHRFLCKSLRSVTGYLFTAHLWLRWSESSRYTERLS